MLSRAFRRGLPAVREVTHAGVFYELHDAARELTLRLNEVQYVVVLHLDGRQPDEVRRALHERYGLALRPSDLAALLEDLERLELLENAPVVHAADFDHERTVAYDQCTLQALALVPRLPAGAGRLVREPITQVLLMEAELPPSPRRPLPLRASFQLHGVLP